MTMVKRRSFMRTPLGAAAGVTGLSGCTANSVTVSNFKTAGPCEGISREKPNIIFILQPTTDMAYMAKRYGKTHSFQGNADTRILLSGSKEDIYAEVKRCMDIGKQYPGFFYDGRQPYPVQYACRCGAVLRRGRAEAEQMVTIYE